MLALDIETYSTIDLTKVGSYRYATHPNTDVLVLAYALQGQAVQTWQPGDRIDPEVISALRAGEDVLAHNAGFDRNIYEHVLVKRYGWPEVAGRWLDSRSLCSLMGIPRSLKEAALALGLDEQKQEDGKRLVKLFSFPHGGAFDRVRPEDAPDDWTRFVEYCRQDVRTTLGLVDRLRTYLPRLYADHAGWEADFQMNRRGVLADLELSEALIAAAEPLMEAITNECIELTGGIGPGQVKRLLAWLQGYGVSLPSLGETEIIEALSGDLPADVRRVLELRLEGSRSSWRKCYAVRDIADGDGRLHDQLAYGSTHTYRWAGRGVQLQNLPRPKLKSYEIEAAIDALLVDPSVVPLLFDKPMEALSSLMRSVLVAPTGKRLGVCDFSKIEVVVLAWLAEDEECLVALRNGEDLYRQLASKIYRVPEPDVTKDQRFTGKSGILGGGYGAGWKAFQGSCRKQGVQIPDSLAKTTINAYRDKHAAVPAFWHNLERAAIRAVAFQEPQQVGPYLEFFAEDLWLFCRLPSGRCLSWFRPEIRRRKRREQLVPELWFQVTGKNGKPIAVNSFGGKLAENVVSSTARDLLAEALVSAESAGLCPVLTIHDEIVCEGPRGIGKALSEVMLQRPAWAPDLPIAVEFEEGERYAK